MIHFTFFEALIFIPILLWPITQIVLVTLIAVSYVFRKHRFAKYYLYFLIVFSIVFSLTTIYFFSQDCV